ncbi:MAG: hypothetical protein U9N61_06945, partial [Euryarchaeota archaeon]|nr:hypothetical protein [Euryarchaeota archaeon]
RNQHQKPICTRGLRGINACGDGCMSSRKEAGSPVTCSGEEVTIFSDACYSHQHVHPLQA